MFIQLICSYRKVMALKVQEIEICNPTLCVFTCSFVFWKVTFIITISCVFHQRFDELWTYEYCCCRELNMQGSGVWFSLSVLWKSLNLDRNLNVYSETVNSDYYTEGQCVGCKELAHDSTPWPCSGIEAQTFWSLVLHPANWVTDSHFMFMSGRLLILWQLSPQMICFHSVQCHKFHLHHPFLAHLSHLPCIFTCPICHSVCDICLWRSILSSNFMGWNNAGVFIDCSLLWYVKPLQNCSLNICR